MKQVEDAETFEGNDRELDAAIIEGRLRLGRIETGEERAIQKRRRSQQRLRRLALDFYGRRCALCDIRERAFLIASHISPWAESVDGRGDLTNVIILCQPHDSLFEFGYWSLSNDLTILRKQMNHPPWVVEALLPDSLSFRAPAFYAPAGNYLEAHRIRNRYA